MNYSTDFVASVVADKYISHMPLERQTREMESLGLKGIKNSTLSRFSALAAASLEKIQDDIFIRIAPYRFSTAHRRDAMEDSE